MSHARPDMRKQLLFVALEGCDVVWLDDLARKAGISTQFAARELKRLGWRKRYEPGGGYKRPQNWGGGSMSTLSRATGTTRKRNPRDYYPTIDPRAVAPLVAYLGSRVRYAEPCAGAGDLVDLLAPHGWECVWAADMLPMRRTVHSTGQLIAQQDVLTLPQAMATEIWLNDIDCFVTNPAWLRRVLHKKIETLMRLRPTWLLFDAAWKETKQAAPYGKYCHTIISVGRLQWVAGSDAQSTDDVSWYGFDATRAAVDGTRFIWPTANRDPVDQLCLL